MKNWEYANKILQVGANIGILLGLILVGVQISETNRIANAQFIADDYANTSNGFSLRIGDSLPVAWAKAGENTIELTDEDVVVVRAYLMREWYQSLRERDISRRGLKELDFDLETTEWVFRNLGNEIALRWWTDNQNGMLNLYPELRDSVNELLIEVGDSHRNFHKTSREAARSGPIFPSDVSSQFN